MSKKTKLRIFILVLLIGLNFYLGKKFIEENHIFLNAQMTRMLAMVGIVLPSNYSSSIFEVVTTPQPFSIKEEQILELVNQKRKAKNLTNLVAEPKLNQAAQKLISSFAETNYQIENQDFGEEIKTILKEIEYEYEMVADVAVIGPLNSQDVVDHWFSQETQSQHLLSADFSKTGVASQEISLNGQTSSVTVLILAKPCASPGIVEKVTITTTAQTSTKTISQPTTAPDIADDDVVKALNEYRADHKIHQLIIDQNLCKYAEKRVQDLVKNGSLDNHEGFKQDFADLNNLPASIQAYSGGAIGENLASQYCINGTTGASFTATTATALIEWCFDSSTKGHREAQLNERYNAVCSRHGNNMYVVIFGE